MRLSEAADALGVHYQTAYAWVRQQQLPARNVRVRDWPRLADGLHAALVAGDEVTARASLGRLAGAVPLADLCDNVIAPALVRIGEQWAAGEVSIAMEHRASAICERLVAGHACGPGGRRR